MPRTVYFATDRQPVGPQPAKDYAGIADPAEPERLHLGRATVSDGLGTEAARTVLSVETLGGDGAAKGVGAVLGDWLGAAATANAIPLLFVHGFSNSFHGALARVAQIADFYAEAQPKPVVLLPMVFTWPSPGDSGKAAYRADRQSAALGGLGLARLFGELAALPEAGRKPLRLLAHSMGNWCLQNAVSALAAKGKVPAGLFRCAILAAADTDADALAQQDKLGQLPVMADQVTVAVFKADPVLKLSDGIIGNGPRLGHGPAKGPLADTVTVIDYIKCVPIPGTPGVPDVVVDWHDTTWNSIFHQYYRNCADVRDDLARVLRSETSFPHRIHYADGTGDDTGTPPRTDANYWYWLQDVTPASDTQRGPPAP